MSEDVRNRVVDVVRIRAGDLDAHPLNWRQHPEGQRQALRAMVDEIGFASVVTVVERDGRYVLLDGHLRADLDPDMVIDAAVLDFDDAEAEKFLLTADPLAALAETDRERLGTLLGRAETERDAVRAFLETIGSRYGAQDQNGASDGAQGHVATAADLPEPQTRRRDLWICGSHRVICGDAFDQRDRARLMAGAEAHALITDPPYGINIVGRQGTAGNFPGTQAPRLAAPAIIGDDQPFDPRPLLSLAPRIILWGAQHYAALLPSEPKWLVWDKKAGAFQGSDLGDCELAWTNLGGAARLLHHTWQGMYRAGEGERDARIHPTQKPVDLMAWCIAQAELGPGLIVLDPFVGSGSTLIACERTGTRCFAMDLDARYVEATVRRWEIMTGQEARFLEATS